MLIPTTWMTWMIHVKGHLTAKDLLHTVSDNFNDAENSNARKKGSEAFIFILHHLDVSLQNQYISIKNLSTLWKQLKAHFDHQQFVLGLNTLHEWNQLRFEFKISKQLLNIIPHYLVSFLNFKFVAMKTLFKRQI